MAPKKEKVIVEGAEAQLPAARNATTTTDKPISKQALEVQRAVLARNLSGSEYERFEALAKGLVAVPKEELDAAREQEG